MIDDHEAELAGTGEYHGATGDPVVPWRPVVDTRPADPRAAEKGQPRSERQPGDDGQPATGWFAPDEGPAGDEGPAPNEELAADDDLAVGGGELEKAEDLGLGEAERALLEWALRQRQSAPGQPFLPVAMAAPDAGPNPDRESDAPPEPAQERREPKPEEPAEPASEEPGLPWEPLHGSAEEAISALIAAGGPDPRDFASPRLSRRAKLVIAFALVVLFVVSALGGFVGYRLTHRAAGSGSEAAGGPAEVRTT
jgi:hypothetical protein